MFDNTNPYTIRVEVIDGKTHYYVKFEDGQGIPRETEISYTVYLEFYKFIKIERNLRRSDERNLEQYEMTDYLLNNRVVNPQQGVEEMIVNMELINSLHKAIAELQEVQMRRFLLYYEFELTYKQIAELEVCTITAVKYSIDKAKSKIKKKLKGLKF